MAEAYSRTCLEHPSEILTAFCGDHDVVICGECIKFNHRLCKHVVSINDASKDVKQFTEFKTTKMIAQHLQSDLEKLKKAREEDYARVGKENKEIKSKMNETIQQMKDTLKKLQHKCNTVVDDKSKMFQSEISEDINLLEDTITEVKETITGLQNNQQIAFLTMKTDKKLICKAKETVRVIHEKVRKETMSLEVNEILEEAIKQRDFGTLIYTNPELERPPELFNEDSKYMATMHGKYEVAEIGQKCYIPSSCFLLDGSIVLINHPQEEIIHLNNKYAIKDRYKISGKPWGVCTVASSQLAVTLYKKKAVQLFSVTNKNRVLEPSSTFSVGTSCRGVCFSSGNIYVCCGGGFWEGPGMIKVFSIDGNHQKSFELEAILEIPRDIIYEPENGYFYITDEKKGIVKIDRFGKYVSTISSENLLSAKGIAFDNKNQILVGCLKTNKVLLFKQSGELLSIPIQGNFDFHSERSLGELIGEDIKVHSVQSLTFLAENDRLLITSNSNFIYIFDLRRVDYH